MDGRRRWARRWRPEVVAADEGQCVEEKVEECVAVAQLLKKNA